MRAGPFGAFPHPDATPSVSLKKPRFFPSWSNSRWRRVDSFNLNHESIGRARHRLDEGVTSWNLINTNSPILYSHSWSCAMISIELLIRHIIMNCARGKRYWFPMSTRLPYSGTEFLKFNELSLSHPSPQIFSFRNSLKRRLAPACSLRSLHEKSETIQKKSQKELLLLSRVASDVLI